jgi:hypothetical protein
MPVQEIEDFKADVAVAAVLLKGVQAIAPDVVDQRLIDFLTRLDADPVGLKILRNVITKP